MARGLIFDSGVGGLSVTAAIRARLPDLQLDYAADDAFRPYGSKSPAALRARLPALLAVLAEMLGSDFIVLACNTASTTALPSIRAALDIPIIGVVPAIKPAASASQTRHIGVLGTPGTVKRAYVDQLIQDFAGGCRVSLKGSVALVAEAENKLAGKDVNISVLEKELDRFIGQTPRIDHIVLACTHFPLLYEDLLQVVGPRISWVDSGAAVARRTQTVAAQIGPAKAAHRTRQLAFTTGNDVDENRRAIFQRYGFETLISLV